MRPRVSALALLTLFGCGAIDRARPAGGEEPATVGAATEAEPSAVTVEVTDIAHEHERSATAASEPDAETAEPEPDPIEALLALEGGATTSVGGPNDGTLENGVALPASGPGFRSNPRRPNPTAIYGTVELIQALVLAAGAVHEAHPGSELFINDIGMPGGGPIARHGSHRAGRDVDVLFYLNDRSGEPMPPVGAFLDPRGRGYDFKDLADPRDDVLVRFDAVRTWAFVRALLEGPHGDLVHRIFVVEHLRTLLLAEAERARAPRAIRARFAELTCQPGYPHDDHLHIRLFCTPEDMAAGCEDSGPTYAWRRRALHELGLRPVLNRPRRNRPPSPQVSAEEARAAAGPMHARVEEWLERREAWLHAPHPGRPFCR